jgi:hypothetical protein
MMRLKKVSSATEEAGKLNSEFTLSMYSDYAL